VSRFRKARPLERAGDSESTRVVTGHDITAACDTLFRTCLRIPEPDVALTIESNFFNVVMQAESCECRLDLGAHLFLNQARWSRLVREYIPRVGVDRFIDHARLIMGGEAREGASTNLYFREPPRFAKKHRWGGCLMAATFRGDNDKAGRATITFFSRTCYIGYIGMVDAAIAAVIAQQIGAPAAIRFHWVISSVQLHAFKAMPYIFTQPDLFEQLNHNTEVVEKHGNKAKEVMTITEYNMAKWLARIKRDAMLHGHQNSILNEKYGPFKRIKRRYFEVTHGKRCKPLPVHKLTFDRAV
jgi:hypothetical protein